MKILVMGAGGVGGYFGAMLAAAGNDVAFVARGPHLAAMRDRGLGVVGPRGDIRIAAPKVSDDPSRLGGADVVLFCVKLYDTESAAEMLREAVGPKTRVITLQNGVDGPERLAKIFGSERVLAGVAYVSAVIEAPGVIRYASQMSSILFGRLDGREDELGELFRERCEASGFAAQTSRDIAVPLWSKMVLLATNAGFSTASRMPIRSCYEDSAVRPVIEAALREAERVAHARGIELPSDVVTRSIELSLSFPADLYASMYHDLMRGGRLEVDGLSGLISRLGYDAGIPTPVHDTLYAVLKPHKDGARK
jgi:2-dehydropantoate 2-reductase